MEGITVAGHRFKDAPGGEVCEACGKRWLDVLNMREMWQPGVIGVAERGALNQIEVDQLNAKLQRIWDAGMRF